MGWRDWPAWLGGGVIFGIIGLIITFFFGTLVLPSIFIPNFNNGVPASSMYYLWAIGFVFYFIIGAILGWIVGRIRNK